jgi:hypothetical protein
VEEAEMTRWRIFAGSSSKSNAWILWQLARRRILQRTDNGDDQRVHGRHHRRFEFDVTGDSEPGTARRTMLSEVA